MSTSLGVAAQKESACYREALLRSQHSYQNGCLLPSAYCFLLTACYERATDMD